MKTAAKAALLPVSLLLAGLAVIISSLSIPLPHQTVDGTMGLEEGFARGPRLPAAVITAKIPDHKREAGNTPPVSLPPELNEFRELKQKALPSKNDRREMGRLRRNRPVLQRALDQISDYDSEIPARQDLVTYLQDALLDRENPEREFIAGKVEEIILSDNLRPEQNRAHRKELAADKGELVLAYLDAHPERLEHLLNASAGSPNIQVIRNALAIGERRRHESIRIIEELNATVSN